MFGLIKRCFGQSKANPVGVDFGSDSLKMAQVTWETGEPQLIAAASAEVPSHARHNLPARMAWFSETARDLLAQGGFQGRRCVLALPAAQMFIQHLRLAKMDDEMTKKALPWEARGKLPIDPSHALLRHVVAGEVYHDQEPKNEIVLMAASRDLVNQLLAAADKAKLDVIGMTVEPIAVVDCFGHIYRRKEDHTAVNCFVDIGAASSRAIIAQGAKILFARSIKIGADHLNRAVAGSLKISMEDARMLRIKLCYLQPGLDQHRQQIAVESAVDETSMSRATLSQQRQTGHDDEGGVAVAIPIASPPQQLNGSTKLPTEPGQQHRLVEEATREAMDQLALELDRCRRYYETTFPNKPVDRLIFIGGEARQRGLCQHVARELSLAAQVGDPLVRMGRTTEVGIESGIDRRQPQPGWVTAVGLSLGPTVASKDAVK